MLKVKKAISLFLILAVIATFFIAGQAATSAAGTGSGLAEHALNAYYSGWNYVYGGSSVGSVDCSGLIYMYAGRERGANAQCANASVSGYMSGGIPNIHGLGVWQDGHVGVYVGDGMAVDARGDDYGVCYQSVYTKSWTMWFKVNGVTYPTDGWEYFNGDYYYYQNGEYLTDTSVTIDGVTYYLDSTGRSSETPSDTSGVVDNNSGSSSSSSSASSLLMVGSSGDRVTKLQERLTELGFYAGDITGYFGSQTEAAYIRFQTAAGVYIDGIAGESDLEILYSDYAPTGTTEDTSTETVDDTDDTDTSAETSTYTNGDFSDGVYEIQSELADLGYFDNEVTGYYGEVTQAAVTEFQVQNGLEATGEVDELTYATLFSSTALENPNKVEPDKIEAPTFPTLPQNSEAKETPTETSEVVMKSVDLASKALGGVNAQEKESLGTKSSDSSSFGVWLIVMAIFMGTAFWLVFSSEKKKKKARYERIKARANRNW